MSFDSLRHGHQMSALEFLRDKPLPSVPSPTLTNPDMVLPSFDGDVHASLPSPARTMKRTPSLNFFRDRMAEQQNARTPAPKKEKRGLMSRKMLLLRSRTGSGMTVNGGQQQQPAPRSVPSDSDTFSTYNSNYASSPTLMDVGNLAPEQVNEKRLSFGGSSFNSEDYAVIPAFLAKYEATDGTTTDDEMFDSDSPAPKRYGYSITIEGGLDAQRRQQEEAEHKSAMLSSRAEQILANAKKRLNVSRRESGVSSRVLTDIVAAHGRQSPRCARSGRAVDPCESEASHLSRILTPHVVCGKRRVRRIWGRVSSPAVPSAASDLSSELANDGTRLHRTCARVRRHRTPGKTTDGIQ